LKRQRGTQSNNWELILIDNACTDNTVDIAQSVWEKDAPVPFRIVREPKPGLVHTRMRGLTEGRYELVCFVDDDNWVCEDWVSRVCKIMADHPEVGACGGLGEPVFEHENVPSWFWDDLAAYAVGPQAEKEGYVPLDRGYLHGAGLTVRRNIILALFKAGFWSVLPGRGASSKIMTSGEEVELCLAMQLAGWKLWYDPRLTYRHYIPSRRLDFNYFLSLCRSFGSCSIVHQAYRSVLKEGQPPAQDCSIRSSLPHLARKFWLYRVCSTMKGLLKVKVKTMFARNKSSQHAIAQAFLLGRLSTLLRSPRLYATLTKSLRTASWRRTFQQLRD
jgi:glycosyltransferase involved in cell wall biosynthesis